MEEEAREVNFGWGRMIHNSILPELASLHLLFALGTSIAGLRNIDRARSSRRAIRIVAAMATLQSSLAPALSLASTSECARPVARMQQLAVSQPRSLLASFEGLRVSGTALSEKVRSAGVSREAGYRGLAVVAEAGKADEVKKDMGGIELFKIDPKAVGTVDMAKGPGAAGKVRIRLQRFGRKKLPFYRIFVATSTTPRDGKHLELVGHYNPLPGENSGAGLSLYHLNVM